MSATPPRDRLWQRRMRAVGLDYRTFEMLAGSPKATISRQLNGYWASGIPLYVKSMIRAWEIMTPEQRERWLREVE